MKSTELSSISARRASRILAVTPEVRADHSLVDAAPTRAAIARLKEAGYTKRWLAVQLGSRATTPSLWFLNKAQVTAKTASKVERLVRLLETGRIRRP